MLRQYLTDARGGAGVTFVGRLSAALPRHGHHHRGGPRAADGLLHAFAHEAPAPPLFVDA